VNVSNKRVAWSYSVLSQFKTCPKQYFHEKILKDFKQAENEHSSYGKEVHKALELRVSKARPLPPNMRQYEPVIDKLARTTGEKYCEMRLALNANFQPVDFFARDVFCRAVIDLLVVANTKGILLDYKTGKVKEDYAQLELAGAMVYKAMPELTELKLVYYWLKENKLTSKKLLPEDCHAVWSQNLPVVNRLEHAIKTNEFPARPSGLCEKYCSVKTCAYNGNKLQ
jgi:PD-(D/E)XK nuclease superfamily